MLKIMEEKKGRKGSGCYGTGKGKNNIGKGQGNIKRMSIGGTGSHFNKA